MAADQTSAQATPERREPCKCKPCANCHGVEKADDCTDHNAIDCGMVCEWHTLQANLGAARGSKVLQDVHKVGQACNVEQLPYTLVTVPRLENKRYHLCQWHFDCWVN